MSEKEEKVETLHRLLIEGEESGFTDCTLEQINRELDAEANHIGSDHDQVRADWLARRASIMRGLAESRAGLGEIKKGKDDDFFEKLRKELREKKGG